MAEPSLEWLPVSPIINLQMSPGSEMKGYMFPMEKTSSDETEVASFEIISLNFSLKSRGLSRRGEGSESPRVKAWMVFKDKLFLSLPHVARF